MVVDMRVNIIMAKKVAKELRQVLKGFLIKVNLKMIKCMDKVNIQ